MFQTLYTNLFSVFLDSKNKIKNISEDKIQISHGRIFHFAW